MYGLQVSQLIVRRVDASAEEQSCISSIDNLARAAELHEVGLVFLVARSNEAMDLAFEFDLLVVVVG